MSAYSASPEGETGGRYIVAFPFEGTGSYPYGRGGRVVVSGLEPIPAIPSLLVGLPNALHAFYSSIADAESGQKWNFWGYMSMFNTVKVLFLTETEISIVNQGPFFPNYQEKGPFKF